MNKPFSHSPGAANRATEARTKLAPASDRPCFGVGASFLCPQCDGPLSDRITDEDTRCSYPCDDGEGFCEQCDTLWTDAELIESPAPRNLPTMEEVQSKIAEVFNPLWKPKGYERIIL